MLDPNREVVPRYVVYTVLERDGRTSAGIIEDESESAVTLRTREGLATIARERIDRIQSSGASFMPEGLEQDLTFQQMADLLAYLRSVRYDRGTSGRSPEEGAVIAEE